MSSFFFRRHSERAIGYPVRDLPISVRRAIVSALVEAWNSLLLEVESLEDEDDATAVLSSVLNSIRGDSGRVPEFDAKFSMVVRDGRCVTYDGSALHKRPDLLVRLADELDENVGWFIECKIVDREHRRSYYRTQGVMRFIEGEYAWAMPAAMMVAYAGDGYAASETLKAALQQTPEKSLDYPEADVWTTSHSREWAYPGQTTGAGDIRLEHLWLYGGSFASS